MAGIGSVGMDGPAGPRSPDHDPVLKRASRRARRRGMKPCSTGGDVENRRQAVETVSSQEPSQAAICRSEPARAIELPLLDPKTPFENRPAAGGIDEQRQKRQRGREHHENDEADEPIDHSQGNRPQARASAAPGKPSAKTLR